MPANTVFNSSDEDPHDIRTQAAPDRPGLSVLTGIKPGAAATWAIAFGIVLAALFLIQMFARPIALLVWGIIIAQALVPIIDRLTHFMKRGFAIGIVYVTLLGVVALIGWLVVPTIAGEGSDFVENAPDMYERGQNWLEQNDVLNGRLSTEELEERALEQAGQFGGQLVSLPLTILNTMFDMLLVIVTSIYWIIAGPSLRQFALSMFPFERQGKVDSVLSEMGQTMGGYVRGIAINTTLMFFLVFIGLSLIGVEYALVLALIVAFLSIVPIVGPIIATVPLVGAALLDSVTTGIIVLVFWVILQQIENYVTMPFIMKTQSEIPPLLVLLAIFWGGSVGGILGALVAIPAAGALRVFFLRGIAPAIRRWTGAIDGDVHGPPSPPISQVST